MNSSDYFRARNRMTPSTNYSFAVSVEDSLSEHSLNFKVNEDNCRISSSSYKQETYNRLLSQSQRLLKKLNVKITSVNAQWKNSCNDRTNLSSLQSQVTEKSEEIKRRIACKQEELQSFKERQNVFNVMKMKLEQSKQLIDSSQVILAESNGILETQLSNVYQLQNDLERHFIDNNYLSQEKDKLIQLRKDIQDRIHFKHQTARNKETKIRKDLETIDKIKSKPRHQHKIKELDELNSVLDMKYAEISQELNETNSRISEMNNQIDRLQY